MAIKGSLREASLPDVVQLLFLGRRTGRLSVASDRDFASIWFEEGWITSAGLVTRPDRLGERLVAAGRLSQSHLEQAMAAHAASVDLSLGDLLVRLGYLERELLESETRRQVEETIYTLFTWDSGTFSFEAGGAPGPGEAIVRLNPEGLLLEGARRVDEWSVIAKKVPSPDAVFALDEGAGSGGGDEALVELERRLLPLLDGVRSVRSLVEVTGLTEFEVSRALYGLLSAGRIHRVASSAAAMPRQEEGRLEEHRNLAVAFYRTGMLVEAEREYRRLAELLPREGEARFRLGLIALRLGRWADARDHLTQALELGGRRAATLHNLALAEEALGNLDAADAALGEAVSIAEDDARLWIGWGLLALRRDQMAVARDRFAHAHDVLGQSPPPAQWYWGCAWAHAHLESWQDAVRIGREGTAAFPDHPILRTALAVLLEVTGEVGEAEAHLRHALEEDPATPQISKNLGDLLYRAARWDEAEEAYERAAALAPELGDDIWFKLGNLACRRGDLAAARTRWETTLSLNPEHALARANLSGAGTAA